MDHTARPNLDLQFGAALICDARHTANIHAADILRCTARLNGENAEPSAAQQMRSRDQTLRIELHRRPQRRNAECHQERGHAIDSSARAFL